MQFTDQGLIISKKYLQDNVYIAKIFTKSYGLYEGIIKIYAYNASCYQHTNEVSCTWKSKSTNNLGYFNCDVKKLNFVDLLKDSRKTYSISSLLSIINFSMQNKLPLPNLYDTFQDYIESQNFSIQKYCQLELNLLSALGYGLDVSMCVVSGSKENLKYVSPKSARAVCEEEGKKYHDKLLPLPNFLLTKTEPDNFQDISNAFNLTGYFLRRYVYQNKPFPIFRHLLISQLEKDFKD